MVVFTKDKRREALEYVNKLHNKGNRASLHMLKEKSNNISNLNILKEKLKTNFKDKKFEKLILFIETTKNKPEIIDL